MSRTAARLALGCAVAGLAASAAAAYAHYRLLLDPAYLSFCDVSVVVSCTDVYASRFSVVGGISVAVPGTIWFAGATLLSLAGLIGPQQVRQHAAGYLFVASVPALAAIIYLGYASFVVLQLVCVLCLTTYVAVLGVFLVSGASAGPLAGLPSRAAADLRLLFGKPVALGLTMAAAAGAGFLLLAFPRDPGGTRPGDAAQGEIAQFEAWYNAQPRVAIDVPAQGADVVVVKFNDYQCPPCRQTFVDYEPIFARYDAERPGAVRLVLRDFPLESECNAGVRTDLHPAGCEAAVAVRLARERGAADALERWLFANQPALTPALVEQAARDVAGVTDFRERYDETLDRVKADIEAGRALGVNATPTFFLNGVRIQGGLPAHLFDHAIAHELRRAAPP